MNPVIALLSIPEGDMSQLIVRSIEEDVVKELKLRAARAGRSAEEEHREILRRALGPKRARQSLKDVLSEMPNVGEDDDFERTDDRGRPVRL
jgi:plasmid stability protein